MIDTNCHILPGLDDGVETWEEAVRMARVASFGGIDTIVATPHHAKGSYFNPSLTVRSSVKRLNEKLEAAGVPVLILPGQEYRLQPDYRIAHLGGQLQALGSSHYLLVELPNGGLPEYFGEFVDYMLSFGITPIIAHPERNKTFMRRPELIYDWLIRGVRFQITAGSVLGIHGRRVKAIASDMCRNQWVQLAASDARNTRTRGMQLREAMGRLRMEFGHELTERLALNAERLVRGRKLLMDEPVKPSRKRRFLIL